MFFDKSQIQLDFKWFLSNCHIYKYPSKSILIYQGEKSETLFYIISGVVYVFIKDDEGKEIIIYRLNKGDFVGENDLFNKTKKRRYWVKTKTSCEVAEIPYISFHRLIKVNINILIYFTAQISKRLQLISSEKIGNLPFLSKMGRVAQIITHLSKKSSAIIEKNGIKIQITSDEISKMIGYSKDVVDKILNMLKDQKLISFSKKSIIIYS